MDLDYHLKKRNGIYLGVAIFLLLAGVCLIIVGGVMYRTTKNELSRKPRDSVGVVVDAGGSGTRLLIYSYSKKQFIQLYYHSCEDSGIATYSEAELHNLKNLLAQCIKDGVEKQNLPLGKKVPIYFGATAGMRLLMHRNMTLYRKVWDLVKEVIDESSLKGEKADTITGFEEAQWAWVAANYLKERLQSDKESYGTVEFGSSSVQIAFAKPNINSSKYEDIQPVDIDGKKINVYGHSYLCYGRNEMERHHLAKITKEFNYTKVVKDPCLFRGYNKTVTSDYLWKPPCVSGNYAKQVFGEDINGPKGEFRIEGAGDYDKCAAQIDRIIDTNCTKSNCGIDNVFQPPVQGSFLALAVFYFAAQFMSLSLTASKDEFLQATKIYCGKSWDEIKAEGKSDPERYSHSRCFDAAYSYFLLTEGFKFDNNTWDIEFTRKISSKKVQWTLGLMYTNRNSMYERFVDILAQTTVEKPGMIAVLVIGIILFLIALLLLFLTCKAKGKHERNVGSSPGVI